MFFAMSANSAEEYQLGPGDAIRITAYNNPDLTTETTIAEDGSISFPLIGRVVVGGMTKANAEQQLSKLLVERGLLRQAEINLAVTQYRSQQVSVLGAVVRPGKYPISAATTALDILAEAGGIASTGSSSIRLIQHDSEGKATQRDIDVNQLVSPGKAGVDLSLHNGDILFVATQPLFYIYGEVQKPGAYPLQRDMTVRQAIATGGGLTIRGTERGVRISRKGKNGAMETNKARLTDALAAGDVVHIKESLF
jgi:polysaccharide export outer membrane protein